jgi:hypothetical protein
MIIFRISAPCKKYLKRPTQGTLQQKNLLPRYYRFCEADVLRIVDVYMY